VARVLIDSGAEWDIFGAAGLGEAARMQELLRREAHRARAVQADGVTALFYAAHAGNARCCDLLLSHGAEASPRARRFWASLTPLHLALQRGYRTVTTRLLEHGADPNAFAVEEGRYWPTPLHAAVRWGGVEDMNLLLDHGADPNGGDSGNGADSFGTSGLTWAIFAGNEAAVRLLLARLLDPRHPGHRGGLHLAAEHGRRSIARLLLENGADPSIHDARGQTPRERAVRFGHTEMIELFGPLSR
jgi:ankyrin repeat protein